jgi:hypothetical protein
MTVAQVDNVKTVTDVVAMARAVSAGKVRGEFVKPVVEEAEEVDEPEIRKETKAKPTAVPKKAKSLADVVDNWDADDE